MARRLPTWHWIRTVRAHGPTIPTIRSVLYALAVRMDDSGEAFTSQTTIASDTALSERTVRDAILEARRSGWLAVVEHARPGQGWRLSHYIACVPDGLNLDSVDLGRDVDLERMADQWAAEHGDIEDRMHGLPRRARGAGPRTAKGAATIAARSRAEKGERAANERLNVRQPSPKGAATIAGNVRQPSPTKFPSKFPSKFPKKKGAFAPDRVTNANGRKPEPGTQPNPTAAKPNGNRNGNIASEVLHVFGGAEQRSRSQQPARPQPARSPAEAEASIRKLILTLPHLSDGEVGKILGADPSKVRSVRHAMAGVA